ncbi:unnamed protein product [Amoebophrya sp. A120]|nr:unnamed protein product [Amoebophrya sp. A120]|eukprot:GSA120T00022765001.1
MSESLVAADGFLATTLQPMKISFNTLRDLHLHERTKMTLILEKQAKQIAENEQKESDAVRENTELLAENRRLRNDAEMKKLQFDQVLAEKAKEDEQQQLFQIEQQYTLRGNLREKMSDIEKLTQRVAEQEKEKYLLQTKIDEFEDEKTDLVRFHEREIHAWKAAKDDLAEEQRESKQQLQDIIQRLEEEKQQNKTLFDLKVKEFEKQLEAEKEQQKKQQEVFQDQQKELKELYNREKQVATTSVTENKKILDELTNELDLLTAQNTSLTKEHEKERNLLREEIAKLKADNRILAAKFEELLSFSGAMEKKNRNLVLGLAKTEKDHSGLVEDYSVLLQVAEQSAGGAGRRAGGGRRRSGSSCRPFYPPRSSATRSASASAQAHQHSSNKRGSSTTPSSSASRSPGGVGTSRSTRRVLPTRGGATTSLHDRGSVSLTPSRAAAARGQHRAHDPDGNPPRRDALSRGRDFVFEGVLEKPTSADPEVQRILDRVDVFLTNKARERRGSPPAGVVATLSSRDRMWRAEKASSSTSPSTTRRVLVDDLQPSGAPLRAAGGGTRSSPTCSRGQNKKPHQPRRWQELANTTHDQYSMHVSPRSSRSRLLRADNDFLVNDRDSRLKSGRYNNSPRLDFTNSKASWSNSLRSTSEVLGGFGNLSKLETKSPTNSVRNGRTSHSPSARSRKESNASFFDDLLRTHDGGLMSKERRFSPRSATAVPPGGGILRGTGSGNYMVSTSHDISPPRGDEQRLLVSQRGSPGGSGSPASKKHVEILEQLSELEEIFLEKATESRTKVENMSKNSGVFFSSSRSPAEDDGRTTHLHSSSHGPPAPGPRPQQRPLAFSDGTSTKPEDVDLQQAWTQLISRNSSRRGSLSSLESSRRLRSPRNRLSLSPKWYSSSARGVVAASSSSSSQLQSVRGSKEVITGRSSSRTGAAPQQFYSEPDGAPAAPVVLEDPVALAPSPAAQDKEQLHLPRPRGCSGHEVPLAQKLLRSPRPPTVLGQNLFIESSSSASGRARSRSPSARKRPESARQSDPNPAATLSSLLAEIDAGSGQQLQQQHHNGSTLISLANANNSQLSIIEDQPWNKSHSPRSKLSQRLRLGPTILSHIKDENEALLRKQMESFRGTTREDPSFQELNESTTSRYAALDSVAKIQRENILLLKAKIEALAATRREQQKADTKIVSQEDHADPAGVSV